MKKLKRTSISNLKNIVAKNIDLVRDIYFGISDSFSKCRTPYFLQLQKRKKNLRI